jgi:hypothetical protein
LPCNLNYKIFFYSKYIKSLGGGEIYEFWYVKYIWFFGIIGRQGPLNNRSSWRTDKISQPHSNQFLRMFEPISNNEIARRDLYFMPCKQMLEISSDLKCSNLFIIDVRHLHFTKKFLVLLLVVFFLFSCTLYADSYIIKTRCHSTFK